MQDENVTGLECIGANGCQMYPSIHIEKQGVIYRVLWFDGS